MSAVDSSIVKFHFQRATFSSDTNLLAEPALASYYMLPWAILRLRGQNSISGRCSGVNWTERSLSGIALAAAHADGLRWPIHNVSTVRQRGRTRLSMLSIKSAASNGDHCAIRAGYSRACQLRKGHQYRPWRSPGDVSSAWPIRDRRYCADPKKPGGHAVLRTIRLARERNCSIR